MTAVSFFDHLFASIFCFLLFYALPWIMTQPKLYSSASKVIPIEPWSRLGTKSKDYYDRLSLCIRIPFIALSAAIGVCAGFTIAEPTSLWVIGVTTGVGAMLGIALYFLKMKD